MYMINIIVCTKVHRKKGTRNGQRKIPHMWPLFFLFPASVYIRRKRWNVGIENTTHLTNALTEIIQDITARGESKTK